MQPDVSHQLAASCIWLVRLSIRATTGLVQRARRAWSGGLRRRAHARNLAGGLAPRRKRLSCGPSAALLRGRRHQRAVRVRRSLRLVHAPAVGAASRSGARAVCGLGLAAIAQSLERSVAGPTPRNTPRIWRMAVRIGSSGSSRRTSADGTRQRTPHVRLAAPDLSQHGLLHASPRGLAVQVAHDQPVCLGLCGLRARASSQAGAVYSVQRAALPSSAVQATTFAPILGRLANSFTLNVQAISLSACSMVETRKYATSLMVHALVAVVSVTKSSHRCPGSRGRDQARRRSRRTSCASTVIHHSANSNVCSTPGCMHVVANSMPSSAAVPGRLG